MIALGLFMLSLGTMLGTTMCMMPGTQTWLALSGGLCIGVGAKLIQDGIHAAIKKG